jgi:hypothetical protein
MIKFLIVLILTANSIFAQNSNQDILTFDADTLRNEYIVRVGNLGHDKSQVEVEMKCFMILKDYEGKLKNVEILGVKQKVSTGGNVFFGGELQEGEYVVTLSYYQNKKRFEKIIKKNVNKS